MALSNTFTPTNYGQMTVTSTSSNQALPAGTGNVLVTNLGPSPVVVLLGTSNAVSVTASTGVAIPSGGQLALVIGSNTYIAAIAVGGGNLAVLNLAVGS